MANPLLPEYVGAEPAENKESALEARVAELESDVASLRVQLRSVGQDTSKVIYRLLSPLYKALQPIFGELEDAGVVNTASTPNKSAAWESVKQRLQPRHREVIDVLLLQGQMARRQISSAIKMDYTNCNKNIIGPLLRQGWLVEVGGKIALKEL